MDALKSELLNAFVTYVVPVLFSGLAGLLAWVFVSLRKKLEAEASNSAAAGVGAKVLHLAESVVSDLEISLKPQLAEAAKDGVLTKAEISQLRSVALERLKAMLGAAGIAELEKMLGVPREAIDKYLMGVVEKAVAVAPSRDVPGIDQAEVPTNPGAKVSPQVAPA